MNKSKYEIIEDAILNLEVVICRELDVDLDHPLIRIHIEHMRNELEDMQENDHPIDFYDDAEKMADCRMLSKEEFLKSYSYLTEQEYNNTKMIDDLKAWQDGSLVNIDAINKLSLGDLEKVSKILEKVK